MSSQDRKPEHKHAALFFRAAEYVGSYPGIADCPDSSEIPVVAFTGRSNSGKSILLSALCDHHQLARASSAPGKTRALNYFFVPPHSAPPNGLYLVDLPGYGFAKLGKGERRALREMVDRFLAEVQNMVRLVVVLDARRKLETEEQNILAFCQTYQRPMVFARTKWDRLNTKEKNAARKDWRHNEIAGMSVAISSPKRIGVFDLLKLIRADLKA